MDRHCADGQPVDDEIEFWRGFIIWWVREKAAPVPARAWEALALAERRNGARYGQLSPADSGGAAAASRPASTTNATAEGKRRWK
jgi:hypothetical protein